MNVVTHVQFSSDPVVQSVIIDLPRVSSRVSLGLLVVRLRVVVGGHHIIGDPRWDPCCVRYCCFCFRELQCRLTE